MRVAGWVRKAAVATAGLLALGLAAPVASAPPAEAAGITTHSWMATEAVQYVDIAELKALLLANMDQVYAGAQFPDSGYVPSTVFGEEAHWQRFFDAYAEVIRTKPGCGPLTAPTGPCASEIAHLMGSIAHGMGDEVWDWLFEPLSPDLDEYYLPPDLAQFQGPGGQELQMDLVAVALYGRSNPDAPPLPSKPDLLAAFRLAGFEGATEEQLDFGQFIQTIIHDAVAAWAPTHIAGLRRDMPYMSANLVTDPGGVDFAARAIAGEWEAMWGRLLGEQPPTEVSVTYPADDQRRIPAGGWVREYQPGSHDDRGGARTRIAAALTYSTPYVPAEGGPGVSTQLPDGAMTLTERDSGDSVAIKEGYPKSVPYNPEAGEHLIDIQPAADLDPCTWYEVDVTELLLDANLEPVKPYQWAFRTGTDADGGRCPDDPYTEDENWLFGTYDDLLGRAVGPFELAFLTNRLDREMDRDQVTNDIVDSQENRRRLVQKAYRAYFGRPANNTARNHWTAQIRWRTLTDMRASLLGSEEFFTKAGGTNETYVAKVYRLVVGRAPDSAGQAYWVGQLAGGVTRETVARRLLLDPETLGNVVKTTYADLLGRTAGPGEVTYWTGRLAARDERLLVKAIVRSPEYFTHAQ